MSELVETSLLDEVEKLTRRKSPKVAKLAKTAKKRAGAPTKLTPAVAARIIAIVLEGNYPRVACGVVGVTKRTLDNWKTRAREAMEEEGVHGLEDIPQDRRIYVEFLLALEMAESASERSLLASAMKGGRGWQASMAIMERRWRDRWGRAPVEEKSGGNAQVVIHLPSPDPERQKRVASVLSGAGAIDGEAREVPDRAPREIEASPEVSINGDSPGANVVDLEQERAAREVEGDI